MGEPKTKQMISWILILHRRLNTKTNGSGKAKVTKERGDITMVKAIKRLEYTSLAKATKERGCITRERGDILLAKATRERGEITMEKATTPTRKREYIREISTMTLKVH